MTQEVCSNGHVRTEENTSWHKDTTRDRVRMRCLSCKRESNQRSRPNTGGLSVREMSIQATDYLHEDIEDLLKLGATWNEILDRGGYSCWNTMMKSLKRRGRDDLLEQLRAKKRAAV